MPMLTGWCKEGHRIEAFISSCDVRIEGPENDTVIAVTGISDVTCPKCGGLIEALAEAG